PAVVDTDEAHFSRSLQPANRVNGRALPELEEAETELATDVNLRPAEIPANPRPNRLRNLLAAVGALALGLAAGTYYFKYVAPYESTDDAFIEAHVAPIAPQVAGRVEQLLVADNEEVRQGQVLVQIDPRDHQAALDQTRANLAAAKSRLEQANAQFTVDRAKVEQEKANVIAADAEAKRAAADLKRYQAVGNLGVSVSQLDLVATQARSSEAAVEAARNKHLASEAQTALDQASIQTAAAEVKRNEATVRQAELNLSYTQVKAPEAGYVTHRTVEVGAYVQTGQALLAIVPRAVWVVANFKETQLARMRPGQAVELRVDAYPQIRFRGHVDSIQTGSGARFSLLPPENASGNYVKVVQRVPVKITFDDTLASRYVLGPGMSVEPVVRVK
ncbi:MAG: HlyD family secretion protein, partial [Verrucomicrobia bacterium]|nr:HlyD family secretion protein [Verrucomicrobiota bacterium]